MRVWDITKKTEIKTTSFTSQCWALDISRNDTSYGTGHKTGEIKLWSLSETREHSSLKNIHRQQITCLKYTPDMDKIVTASIDNKIKVTDLKTNKILHEIESPDLFINSAICKFAISPNSQYCVMGGHTGIIFVFNIKTGEFVEAFDEEHNIGVLGVDWARGSASTVATMDKSGLLYMWR